MPATAQQYENLLIQLSPPGAAWPVEEGTTWRVLLGARAEELARLHNRAEALFEEADPRTASELLPDWERVLGLPDDCAGAADTLEERRAALLAKLTGIGGQSRAYYIGVAAALGFTVTIEEFPVFTCESPCEDAVTDETWRFTWRVNGPTTTVRDFTCESTCEEPLRDWGHEVLECAMTRLKPAHTAVLFAYGNTGVLLLDNGLPLLLDDGTPLSLD
jgi:uncharacterized protein YmfQ (DUF2313 family)